MNIEGTLMDLKGCQFEYEGTLETLNDWRYAAGVYTLSTSKKERKMDVSRVRDFLETIKPIQKKESTISVLGKQEVNMISSVNNSFADVKDMILDNMKKLNKEKFTQEDLDRARATNEGAKVLIDMAKVQVDMVKELRR